ncbi:hypothetical protein EYZ49_23285 [Salmonella enterica subsp. salamae serovar 13,22:z:-]|uniref:hypothetical protein n=1 Tax=Salmonella enterica TaxID=28901 RepID=UPI0010340947|nr:hypothetical protein [Salmonella enterica]TBN93426.1 hypothetical protein EYZ49_23285 [Salmonella enterica subsp. salamae serovar 13,22:z:-]
MIDATNFKDNLIEFTVEEFIIYLNEFYSDLRSTPSPKGLELGEYLDIIFDKIISVVGIVKAGDFIYHPTMVIKSFLSDPTRQRQEYIYWDD